jgi:hypothetical protein
MEPSILRNIRLFKYKFKLENRMMNIIKLLATACLLNLLIGQTAVAKLALSKVEIKAQAVEICRDKAIERYGEHSIDAMQKKAKFSRNVSRVNWNNGLNGALVKMVVKQKTKGLIKLSCLVKTDGTTTFFKR